MYCLIQRNKKSMGSSSSIESDEPCGCVHVEHEGFYEMLQSFESTYPNQEIRGFFVQPLECMCIMGFEAEIGFTALFELEKTAQSLYTINCFLHALKDEPRTYAILCKKMQKQLVQNKIEESQNELERRRLRLLNDKNFVGFTKQAIGLDDEFSPSLHTRVLNLTIWLSDLSSLVTISDEYKIDILRTNSILLKSLTIVIYGIQEISLRDINTLCNFLEIQNTRCIINTVRRYLSFSLVHEKKKRQRED